MDAKARLTERVRRAEAGADALQAAGPLVISAGTVAEALIVADRRGLGVEMRRLIDGLGFAVECVTASTARRVADADARRGRRRPGGTVEPQ